MQRQDYDHLFKIHVLGEANTGKSSLLSRYIDDDFTTSYLGSIGRHFGIKNLTIDAKKIKLQIYDNAPQGRFASVTEHSNYIGTHAVIIAFDLTDKASFDALPKWLTYANKIDQPIIILVGTKADLKDQRQVSDQDIETFMANSSHKIHAYHETSAKENRNILKAIENVVKALIQKLAPKTNSHKTTNSSEKSGLNSFFSSFSCFSFANDEQPITEPKPSSFTKKQ